MTKLSKLVVSCVFKAFFISAFAAVGLLHVGAASAALPSRPLQECAAEYQARGAELSSSGVNAAVFYHECWWHSQAGKTTDISRYAPVARKKAETASRQAERVTVRRTATRALRVLQSRLHRLALRGHRSAPQRQIFAQDASKKPAARASKVAAHVRATRQAVRQPLRTAYAGARWARRERWVRTAQSAPFGINDGRFLGLHIAGLDGRRAWIGAETRFGERKMPAVVVGPMTTEAFRGRRLRCWSQPNVLFVNEGPHWGPSLVCDSRIGSFEQAPWFEAYR